VTPAFVLVASPIATLGSKFCFHPENYSHSFLIIRVIRVMKFLVIRFSSIGDIVLTTPVIRCIKQQLPGAEVHFLTKASMKTVTEHNPYIDKFFYYNKNLKELKQQLKQ